MALILNIETSSINCSVSLSEDGRVIFSQKDKGEMNHAAVLAPFVENCMKEVRENNKNLDAVAVSLGPGSYTGLRIGLSLAKGLAYSLGIPLIGLDTLKLLAVKGMFEYPEWEGDELIVPMIDARRMEVYTACYDSRLHPVIEETPMILDENSYKQLIEKKKILFIGNGSEKFHGIYSGKNGIWMGTSMPTADDMAVPAEKAFLNNEFIDIAYSVPNYIKEFQTTVPKSRI